MPPPLACGGWGGVARELAQERAEGAQTLKYPAQSLEDQFSSESAPVARRRAAPHASGHELRRLSAHNMAAICAGRPKSWTETATCVPTPCARTSQGARARRSAGKALRLRGAAAFEAIGDSTRSICHGCAPKSSGAPLGGPGVHRVGRVIGG